MHLSVDMANSQDAYSMRCVPQVHGVVHDTLEFVRKILTTEMNSASDNPVCMNAYCIVPAIIFIHFHVLVDCSQDQ